MYSPNRKDTDTMDIKIQKVSMTYPNGKQALKDLSLDLRAPSLVGLLGPNGAGKSTLMKLLVAALMPTSGTIKVDGQPLAKSDKHLKSQLGYLPQDFGLFDELTVAQFLDYMAALKGIREPKAVIGETIRKVNLEEKAKSKIRTLSGGQRQRVGILEQFLHTVEIQEPVTQFDERLWSSLVDFVAVYGEKDIRVTFKDGTEIQA